jgi:8-oxo-dGTP diphosphatase
MKSTQYVQRNEVNKFPLVGVGVIIVRDGLVLLGERQGSHGAGTWALPGGHLEFGESVEDCARRETEEETGLLLRTITPAPYTNDVMQSEGKHYVTVFVQASPLPGEAQLLEPNKCREWRWFRWPELPSNLFQPLKTLVEQGFVPNHTTSTYQSATEANRES